MFNPERNPASRIYLPEEESEMKARLLMDSRIRQSNGSRLAEYITGLRPDNPEMADRLVSDQQIIREKYGLPDRLQILVDSLEYERFLRGIAKKFGIKIRETSDCGSFFEETPGASGVYLGGSNQLGVDINRESSDSHIKSMIILEHELIHGIQQRYYPAMPVELREYEAYISGMNESFVKSKPNPEILELLFSHLIGYSVHHSYKERSKKEGKKVIPEWENPKFFLEKIDKLPVDEVDRYLKNLEDDPNLEI